MSTPNLLDKVREQLAKKKPKELAAIAVAIGVNYATVLRIRDGASDPAYGKVQALADLFKLTVKS